MKMKNKSVIHGIIAGPALAAVYFVIVRIAHAIDEFISVWYLMVPLIAGFGVQVGLL